MWKFYGYHLHEKLDIYDTNVMQINYKKFLAEAVWAIVFNTDV